MTALLIYKFWDPSFVIETCQVRFLVYIFGHSVTTYSLLAGTHVGSWSRGFTYLCHQCIARDFGILRPVEQKLLSVLNNMILPRMIEFVTWTCETQKLQILCALTIQSGGSQLNCVPLPWKVKYSWKLVLCLFSRCILASLGVSECLCAYIYIIYIHTYWI